MSAHPFVLLAGASAMAAAITAARMLGPFYGLGPFLWSAVAAVALAALGLGLVAGGRRGGPAGAPAPALPLAASGCWMLLVPLVRTPLLLALEPLDPRLGGVVAAAVVAGPPAALLGSVLPAAVRFGVSASRDAGRAAGDVIAGFAAAAAAAAPLTTFALLPALGASRLAILTGALLVAGAVAAHRAGRRSLASAGAGAALIGIAAFLYAKAPASGAAPAAGVIAIARGAAREVRVVEKDGARYLLGDGSIHAVVAPETWAPLDRAAAALEVGKLLFPRPGRLLVLGLRGGAVARSYAFGGWSVRAVEPDPASAAAATRHFGFDPSVAEVRHADPRAFVRRDRGSHDLIVLDAFADNFIPPHLATREFFASLAARLAPGGVLAVVVEAVGWDDVLVRSLAATLRTRFARVAALPTGEPPNALGSVLLLAADRELEVPEGSLPDPFEHLADPARHWIAVRVNHAWANQFLPDARGAPVLTDDRCPADLWGERINRAARRELHGFFGARGGSW